MLTKAGGMFEKYLNLDSSNKIGVSSPAQCHCDSSEFQ